MTLQPELIGSQRQQQIYMAGFQKMTPTIPLSFEELEQKAKEALSPESFWYVAGGAGGGDTMRANLAAFRRWRLVPRMLRDVGSRSLAVDLFGKRYRSPVFIAPIGVQSIVRKEGELLTARAAASLDVPYIHSTAASHSIEEAAEAVGSGPRWYQLYWSKDKDLNRSFLARAEKAGYDALVVTLDTRSLAWRERDLQLAYLPFLNSEGIQNYLSDPVFLSALPSSPKDDPFTAVMHFLSVFSCQTHSWDDLADLRKHWKGPMLLKGILHPEDAKEAIRRGADGVIVSNHGGRQMDGAVAALDALPRVAEAVGSSIPVLFDSGIRRAADAIKAMALGAKAVLLGRPWVYGLALGGEEGVRDVLSNFLADLDLSLGLLGHTSVDQISRDDLVEDPSGGR
jgi:isopentenyl diphosphate isomerase/L-lactate dehydrogenase-like FMN-dependent dehydrogenase